MRVASALAFACALVVGPAVTTAVQAADATLASAVKRGDKTAVHRLLAAKADVNAAEPDGTTALHWAAESGQVDVVQALLKAGASANVANRYGVTPLQLAATAGNVPMIQALITAGADVHTALPEGETVLMTAARTGSVDALRVLLDRGADPHARERWFGETAIIWAAAENHGAAVQLLASRGADINVRSSQLDIKRRRSGQSVLSLGYWTPLMYAARENAIDAGRALAAAGASLDLTDPDGATALVIAIINAHYDFAAWLLEAGADPNVVDNDAAMGPLYAAIDMHRLAVGHGRPNPKPSGLLDAVEIVRRLLARGANPNAALKAPTMQRHHTAGDGSLGAGATPLMRAAKSGDVDVMRLLIAAGADVKAVMPNKATPLMFAAGLGWRNGSPAAPSYDQGTDEEAVAAIDLLIGAGLDINATTDNGDTALHLALAGRSSEIIVRALLDRGANLNAQNKRGQTPLAAALASRKDLSALIAILKQAAGQ
jgi:ankyrin repeat protein